MKKKKLLYILLFVAGLIGILDTIFVLAVVPGVNLGIVLPSVIGISLCFFSFIKLKNSNKVFIKNKKLKRIVLYISVSGLVFFLIIESMILFSGYSRADEDIDFILVLGAGIDSKGNPSPLLKNRLDKCINYLKSNPEADIIVSGGKGYNEPLTEAESMKKYLVENGVNKKSIILEDKATSTYENFLFTKDILIKETCFNSKVLIITNDFHMMRAKLIAENLGFKAYGLSCSTPKSTVLNNYLREFFAVLKTWIIDLR